MPPGYFLDGGTHGDVLLPGKQLKQRPARKPMILMGANPEALFAALVARREQSPEA